MPAMKACLLSVSVALLLLTAPAAAKGKVEAKEAFRRGLQYYNLGDFKSALDGFKEAYLDYPDPSFLFNIGQCQRQLGNKQEALLAYKAYLREAKDASNRDEISTLVHNLEQSLHDDEVNRRVKPEGALAPNDSSGTATESTPAAQTLASASVTAEAPARAKPVYKQWWLWTAVGVVAVGVGVGLGVGLTRSSTHFPSAMPSDGTIRF
jgi:tetratricopeptide (TPR) repeat protein